MEISNTNLTGWARAACYLFYISIKNEVIVPGSKCMFSMDSMIQFLFTEIHLEVISRPRHLEVKDDSHHP